MSTATNATLHHRIAAGKGVRERLARIRRRQTYLVDRGFQLTVTRQFLVVFFAGVTLGIGNAYVILKIMSEEIHSGMETALLYGYPLVLVGISVTLVFLLCIFFSHRIAGPAYKLSLALARIVQGDLCVKIRLREEDLLKDLAEGLNLTCRELRDSFEQVKWEMQRMSSLAQGNPDLQRSIRKVERIVESYRIDPNAELMAKPAKQPQA